MTKPLISPDVWYLGATPDGARWLWVQDHTNPRTDYAFLDAHPEAINVTDTKEGRAALRLCRAFAETFPE